MTSPVDPRSCPLCGDSNACGMAAGRSTCWCFAAKVPGDVLERVPPKAQELACVCEACASGERSPQATARVLATVDRAR